MQTFHLIAAFAALSSARAIANQSITCRELYIPVSAKAMNVDLSNDSNSTSASIAVGGNFTIRGRYCKPTKDVKSRRETLQMLVHGITYTVDYWSGLAPPGTKPGQDEYSWIKYASEQGYPTLSLDRLCNGESSRPNGTTFCQQRLDAQVIHKVVKAARSGALPGIRKKFSKIIYVGHSYGSIVGNLITKQHPKDMDAFVATGFSLNLMGGQPDWPPAQDLQPKKWGFLNDPAYLLVNSEKEARESFYFGSYKRSEAHYDYVHRQTVTQGELGTDEIGPAPDFSGFVFVLNGNNDYFFCAAPKTAAASGNQRNCSDGFSSGVKDAYPNASGFGYYNTANTGHCLNTHTTAQESYKAAHDFLDGQGL